MIGYYLEHPVDGISVSRPLGVAATGERKNEVRRGKLRKEEEKGVT